MAKTKTILFFCPKYGKSERCPEIIELEKRLAEVEAERDRYRDGLVNVDGVIRRQRVWAGTKWQYNGVTPHRQQKALAIATQALTQPTEETDTKVPKSD